MHVLPVKRARLERKTTRKKVCAERLLANSNNNANKDLLRKLKAFVLYQIIMQFINNKLDMIQWNNIKESVNEYIITH